MLINDDISNHPRTHPSACGLTQGDNDADVFSVLEPFRFCVMLFDFENT